MLTKAAFILIFILTVLGIAISAIADQSSIIHDPPTKQEANKATNQKENPETPNQDSPPPPPSVNLTSTPPLQEIRNKECYHYSKEEKASWWNFSLTDALLVIFTCGLVIVGWLQICVLRGTLKATLRAADAAKKSADALPAIERAYLFVKITMENPDEEGIAGTTYEEPQYNMDNVKVIITNHGKTPAILTKHPCTNEVLTNDEIDEKIAKIASDDIDTWLPIGPVIIDSTSKPTILPADFFMTVNKWKQITMDKAFLVCIGCLHYKDIFGETHKTVFCWKYEQFSGFHYDKDPKRNYRT